MNLQISFVRFAYVAILCSFLEMDNSHSSYQSALIISFMSKGLKFQFYIQRYVFPPLVFLYGILGEISEEAMRSEKFSLSRSTTNMLLSEFN